MGDRAAAGKEPRRLHRDGGVADLDSPGRISRQPGKRASGSPRAWPIPFATSSVVQHRGPLPILVPFSTDDIGCSHGSRAHVRVCWSLIRYGFGVQRINLAIKPSSIYWYKAFSRWPRNGSWARRESSASCRCQAKSWLLLVTGVWPLPLPVRRGVASSSEASRTGLVIQRRVAHGAQRK